MSMVTVAAVKAFDRDGIAYEPGDPVTVQAIDAAVMAQCGLVDLNGAPRSRVPAMTTIAMEPEQPADAPAPAHAKRKPRAPRLAGVKSRRYNRRDMVPEGQ